MFHIDEMVKGKIINYKLLRYPDIIRVEEATDFFYDTTTIRGKCLQGNDLKTNMILSHIQPILDGNVVKHKSRTYHW